MTDTVAALDTPLRFIDQTLADQRSLSDENGPMGDSRRGLAGYYRYNPRRVERLIRAHGIQRPLVHESVMRRIRAGQDAYAPIVLPLKFDVLGIDGKQQVDSKQYLGDDTKHYAATVTRVFNRVWLRRVIYFATLGATLTLLTIPLVSDLPTGCMSALCVASPLIGALDFMLPSFAGPWARWYVNRPDLFFVLGGLAVGGLWLGGRIQRAIFDTMRGIWYANSATTPSCMTPHKRVKAPSLLGVALEEMRESAPYQFVLKTIRHAVLPISFGVVLLTTLLILANNTYYGAQVAGGKVCVASNRPPLELQPGAVASVSLTTWEACKSTEVRVARGGTYEVELEIQEPWVDGGYSPTAADRGTGVKADLRGVDKPSWLMHLASIMKREPSERYMQPMARIGDKGTTVIVLKNDPSLPTMHPLTTLRARFVAPEDGELYLYVNDAVGLPNDPDHFLRNNCGTARGTVRLVGAGEGRRGATAPMVGASSAAPSTVLTPPARCP
jgi:hypothetical protein